MTKIIGVLQFVIFLFGFPWVLDHIVQNVRSFPLGVNILMIYVIIMIVSLFGMIGTLIDE